MTESHSLTAVSVSLMGEAIDPSRRLTVSHPFRGETVRLGPAEKETPRGGRQNYRTAKP